MTKAWETRESGTSGENKSRYSRAKENKNQEIREKLMNRRRQGGEGEKERRKVEGQKEEENRSEESMIEGEQDRQEKRGGWDGDTCSAAQLRDKDNKH